MEIQQTFLQMVMGVLERVHPNRFEILKPGRCNPKNFKSYQRLSKNKETFNILIHYPEINITNSLNFKHKIQDLFILLVIKEKKLMNMVGFRSTFTFREIVARYTHSHIHSGIYNYGTEFCTGDSGSGFNGTYNSMLYNVPTKEQFEHFIHSLTQFLSWESIEGVPYIPLIRVDYEVDNVGIKINNLPAEFKQELFNCILIIPNDRYGYLDLQINPSEELIRLTPNEYKRIKYQDEIYIKRTTVKETEKEEFLFKTKNFDIKYKVVKTQNDVEGIEDNDVGASKEFIQEIQKSLITEFNNIILWKK